MHMQDGSSRENNRINQPWYLNTGITNWLNSIVSDSPASSDLDVKCGAAHAGPGEAHHHAHWGLLQAERNTYE